ncbi:MAG: DUF4159 domain-containing protein [Planctomycetia bacterium]|nr:MAG: DUF4159 domain-containing protein [Planctomycetia bacterium]
MPYDRHSRCAARAIFTLLFFIGSAAGAIAAGEDFSTVTDDAVRAAVDRGVEYIRNRQTGVHWEPHGRAEDDRHFGGSTALALLALLYAGEDPRSPRMKDSLDWLASKPLRSVYAVGLRAHALAIVPGDRYRDRLTRDVQWLIDAQHPRGSDHEGGFGYETHREGGCDNSNSQVGVLGAWMAAEAGVTVPDEFWYLVENHWLRVQTREGGWGYQKDGPNGSMTAAGLATMFVVLDLVYARDTGKFDGKATSRCGMLQETGKVVSSITRAMQYLSDIFALENPNGDSGWTYYYLYGVERVGRASGRKYFGDKDWFKLGARFLLAKQDVKEGSWDPLTSNAEMNTLHHTCFAVMFLCHGRAPLLFNKLDYGAGANTKTRDVAGLNRYVQRSSEKLLNWQTVTLGGEFSDWLEAPVLYISGHDDPRFAEADVQRIREYCLRGGVVLGVACCSKPEFSAGFRRLAARAFPEYPIRELPPRHPLFNGDVQFPIAEPPPMFEVHSGSRTLMLLSPTDISAAWHQFLIHKYEPHLQLGANIFWYATDKSTFASRLATIEIPSRNARPRQSVAVARMAHEGGWDVEAFGWTRLSRHVANQGGVRLLVTSGVKFENLNFEEFKVAYVTGTKAMRLSREDRESLRKFLSAGGTLLADAANASTEFLNSIEEELTDVLRTQPLAVPEDSALLTGAGILGAADVTRVNVRQAARSMAGTSGAPRLRGYRIGRRWAVLYSPLDLSSGFLGTPIFGCRGYTPESALDIARNMMLYAALSSSEKAKIDREAR